MKRRYCLVVYNEESNLEQILDVLRQAKSKKIPCFLFFKQGVVIPEELNGIGWAAFSSYIPETFKIDEIEMNNTIEAYFRFKDGQNVSNKS